MRALTPERAAAALLVGALTDREDGMGEAGSLNESDNFALAGRAPEGLPDPCAVHSGFDGCRDWLEGSGRAVPSEIPVPDVVG